MGRSSLDRYNEKRDFKRTPEPSGKRDGAARHNPRFVVQKHGARRLHYDFRLEMDGVLKSWAVPKGPSLDPGEKRLAVRTEDHPLDYARFEGIIPPSQYGAGPVMLWDRGEWGALDADPLRALEKGRLRFYLEGNKLHGEFTLARMARRGDGENWLLIKSRDDRAAKDPGFLRRTDYSVESGRAFAEIAAGVDKPPVPSLAELAGTYTGVQLATLVDAPPRSGAWLHEIKYDGYRILAFAGPGGVRIHTRNGHDWTDRMPVLARALGEVDAGTFVLDGEAVMLNQRGLTDFKALQNALDGADAPMRGYFFDLLHWQGTDYAGRPLAERRAVLETLFERIGGEGPLYLSRPIAGRGDEVVAAACRMGLEGIVSKQKQSLYRPGRQRSWVKSKCEYRQEFVICGFVPASDNPRAVGALHLGYHRDGRLVYAGKVGTGFNHEETVRLYKRLSPLVQDKPPFDRAPRGAFGATRWVRPQLACEVRFAAWTASGKLRHASYQGLRADKPPRAITREVPQHLAADNGGRVGGVTISNAGRVIFPSAGVTKGELAEFYARMAGFILAHIAGRAITLVRCPGGIEEECFFQRSRGEGMPEHIHRVESVHKGKKHEYMYVKDEKGLIEVVQMGGVEIHPWGSRVDRMELADRIVFDLDPGPGVPFEAVKLAARDVRGRLAALGLESFLKTTGGKGLHVTAPIRRRYDWAEVKRFARGFAKRMAADVPAAYTTTLSKSRRAGKIFIDYLRNDYTATAVMDYCVRSRPGAPVALPLAWDELDALQQPGQFHMHDALERTGRAERLLREYRDTRQGLTQKILEKF